MAATALLPCLPCSATQAAANCLQMLAAPQAASPFAFPHFTCQHFMGICTCPWLPAAPCRCRTHAPYQCPNPLLLLCRSSRESAPASRPRQCLIPALITHPAIPHPFLSPIPLLPQFMGVSTCPPAMITGEC